MTTERLPDAGVSHADKSRLRKMADAADHVTREILAGMLTSVTAGQIAC